MSCVLHASSAINRPVTHEKCKRDTLSLTSTFNHWLPTWNYTWPSAPREAVFEDKHQTGQMLLPIRKVGKGASARVASLSSQVTGQPASGLPLPEDSVTLFSQRPLLPLPSTQCKFPR